LNVELSYYDNNFINKKYIIIHFLLPRQPSPLDKQRCQGSTFASAIVLCLATRIALKIGKAGIIGSVRTYFMTGKLILHTHNKR